MSGPIPAAGSATMTTAAPAERPRKRYRVGIVGCGNVVTRKHGPAWLALRNSFEVVAVADPVAASRERAGGLLGLDAADGHSDWEELLRREDVDVVDVCTPQHLRRAAVVDAIDHGKHVLAEKPLGTVPAEAADIAARVRASGVTLGTGHNYLFLPEVVAARRIIDRGEIGEVEAVVLNYLGVVDRPGAASYQPFWRHGRAAGGGVLMDMLHGLYLAEAFLGRPVRRISAYATARSFGAEVEDMALCRLETDTNVALVNVAWGNGPGGIDVTGSVGRVSVRYQHDGTSPFAPVEALTVTSPQGWRTVPVNVEPDYASFASVFADFGTALAEGRSPIAPAEAGLRVLELVLGAYKSAALERSVELPLQPHDPVYTKGLAGLSELDVSSGSNVRRRRLFGLSPKDDPAVRAPGEAEHP